MKRLLSLWVLGLSSCGLLPRSTPEPVPVMSRGAEVSEELVVFLPGRWSPIDEFEREGFFEIARERWPRARLVAADLHLGYYRKQTMALRLHEDVIAPARRDGVKTVRVVGISMGGLGGLIHSLEYPSDIDELILLSPFVGEEEVISEVADAGGVRKWNVEPQGPRDFSRRLWRGLESEWIEKGNRPLVQLACGSDDRLAASSRQFASDFLNEEVIWQPGGHDWPTWRVLFRQLID